MDNQRRIMTGCIRILIIVEVFLVIFACDRQDKDGPEASKTPQGTVPVHADINAADAPEGVSLPAHLLESEEKEPENKKPIIKDFTVNTGDSCLGIFKNNGISNSLSYKIIQASKGVFDLSRIQPGHVMTLVFSPENQELTRVAYEISYLSRLVIDLDGDTIHAARQSIERVLPDTYAGQLDRVDITIEKGDSVYGILHRLGIGDYQIDLVFDAAKKVFDLSRIVPGHELSVWITQDGFPRIGRLSYEIDGLHFLEIEPEDSRFQAYRHSLKVDIRYERSQGAIENSLYESGINAGLSTEVVMELTDVFAWDINFFTDIRSGDTYTVVYEKYYVRDEFKGDGRVIAASFVNQGTPHIAIYFNDHKGGKGYYDKNGKPIRKLFLKAPLRYRRISSGFSYHRMHPVFHVVKPHLGVDYAASTGTPVVALGDGKIVLKRWGKGYGRHIRIKHRAGYYTYYGHFSRYARGMEVGKWVKQGDVIGYVGQSGVATGPHLDFRVKKDGRFINPLKLKSVAGPRLHGSALDAFKKVAARRISMLDNTDLNNDMIVGKRD